jgi:hypothetical protein
MNTFKITIVSLLITLSSCSKMDTNSGSGKVKIFKELNNWIADKTTSEPTLDEKIELQLDSITSQVKTHSLYPDELEMEVIKTTNIDLNKIVGEYVTGTKTVKRKNSINGSIEFIHLNEETKAKLLTKFKTDNISFRVLALRFKNRITDNQIQFEYLNVLFDQNGEYRLLADRTDLNDISSKAEPIASFYINDFIKAILEEMNSETVVDDPKKDSNITYLTKEEFANIMPSGRKDFMEHNLEWIEKTQKEDTEKIEKDESLNSTEKAEYLKEIENDYAKRIEDVKRDGETRFR